MPELDIEVQLTGHNANVFNLMSLVTLAMKREGYEDLVDEFRAEIHSSASYGEALKIMKEWVNVV